MGKGTKRRLGWSSLAAGVYSGGIGASLFWTNRTTESQGDVSTDHLVWQIILGTLCIGIGQAFSLASHNHSSHSSWGVVVDGAGKVLALGGWSLGLIASIGFTAIGSDVSEAAAGGLLGVSMVVVPVLLIAGGAVGLFFGRADADEAPLAPKHAM